MRGVHSEGSAVQREAGVIQGITIVLTGFLPILAIVSLTVAVPSIMGHFNDIENVGLLAPVLVSAPGLTIAIFAPVFGLFVDRVGRRPFLIFGALLYGFAGVAPYFLDNIYHIIASRLVLGIAEAAILTIMNTLIADYWDTNGRRRWLMFQGIAGPALAAGVIAASGFLTEYRWNGTFLVYSVAFLLFIAIYLFLFEPSKKQAVHNETEAADDNPRYHLMGLVFVVTLLLSSLYYVWIIQGGRAFNEVGVSDPSGLGVLFSVVSFCVPLGAVIFGIMSARLSAPMQLLITFTTLGVGLAMIGYFRNPYWMVVGLIVQQTAAGMSVPTLILWTQSLFPYSVRGRAMGVWSSAFFLGQFGSPFLVNEAVGTLGSVKAAFVGAGIAGVAIAVVIAAIHVTVHSAKRKSPRPVVG